MLSLGNFSSQLGGNALLHNPLWQNLHFPSKSISFSNLTKPHVFFGETRTGFCSNAMKTQKKGEFNLSEVGGEDDEFEDDFDGEFFDIEEDSDIDGDDVDEAVIPLTNMKKWLENRPRGFGEGKVYDTSIEDKLMEEIEQSRKAQLANVNKLKNNPAKPSSKKDRSPQKKDSVPIQEGCRVRLFNLPKKKNIHRDLRLAFEGVPGMVDILPVVSGNEKTRDPVCKGLAFIDFRNENEAYKFVQNFSGNVITFGKVQKTIKCEIVNKTTPKPSYHVLVDETKNSSRKALLCLDEDSNDGAETDIPLFVSQEESSVIEHHHVEENHILEQFEDDAEFEETSIASESGSFEILDEREGSATNPLSSKQERELELNERKVESKRRKDKIPKLNIPGSAKRLKIREKALLDGVFSKYGPSATSNVKGHSK